MSYQAAKPFGRRRTDKVLPADEQRYLESIRRDVDQDSTGLIRRYLRLSQKLLDMEGGESQQSQDSESHHRKTPSRAA